MNRPAPAAVLVIGSANLDFVVRAAHIPAPGETVLGRDFSTHPGGKGANQAVACARAGGVATRMLLALGDDAFCAPIEASLAEAGVACDVVRVAGHATGTAFICVSDAADNAITVAPGANGVLAPEHLSGFDGAGYLLLQLETPLASVAAFARRAREADVRVVLNAAPAQALEPALLEQVDVLVVNEGELRLLAGGGGSDSIAADLARIGVPCVVVTLGERGCIAREGGQLHAMPAFKVQAVDTTAAGDTFCGVLTASLSRGDALQQALREAGAASALACTRAGAQTSIPARGDVLALLESVPAVEKEAAALLRHVGA